jgi:4-diphosphocytidyl-2-C-methyl-D-erythritol kinase
VWGATADEEVLKTLALRIGSDVPYFLTDATAYAEGRGEVLTPVNVPIPYWIVLVNPNIHLSTPWAYGELARHRNGAFPVRRRLLDSFIAAPEQTILASENDFEPVVFAAHPKIAKIKLQMQELGARLALMSGSGSSLFGLFDDMIAALKAVQFFSREHFVHLTEPNFFPKGL